MAIETEDKFKYNDTEDILEIICRKCGVTVANFGPNGQPKEIEKEKNRHKCLDKHLNTQPKFQ